MDVARVMQSSLVFEQNPVASIHFAHQLMSLLNTMEQSHWSRSVNSPLLRGHPVLYRVANRLLNGYGYRILQDFCESVATLSNYLSGAMSTVVVESSVASCGRAEVGRFHRIRGNQILMLIPIVGCESDDESKVERNMGLLRALGFAADTVSGMEGLVDDAWEELSQLK